jgi:hypothetical protein
MNSRIISFIALLVSMASLSYVIWLHHNINSFAQAALRQRESELVYHFTPNMFDLYRGLGVAENKLPKSPQTLEELFQPLVGIITNMDSPPEQPAQSSDVATNDAIKENWVNFALSTNMGDLALLQKNLQAKQIHCSEAVSDLGTASFSVDSKDFTRARAIAANVISRDSLTVRINADTNSNGYEVFENGKKVSEEYF